MDSNEENFELANNSNKGSSERIAALEVSHEMLTNDVRSLAKSVRDVARQNQESMNALSKELSHSIEAVTDRISSTTKTPWANLLAGVGIILVVAGAFCSGYLRDQGRIERTVYDIQKSLGDHLSSKGHFRTEANEKAIRELDVVLQREMRLLDARADTEIKAISERLHREMELQGRALKIQADLSQAQISKNLRWQEEHDQRVVGLNASQNERLKALERETYIKD